MTRRFGCMAEVARNATPLPPHFVRSPSPQRRPHRAGRGGVPLAGRDADERIAGMRFFPLLALT